MLQCRFVRLAIFSGHNSQFDGQILFYPTGHYFKHSPLYLILAILGHISIVTCTLCLYEQYQLRLYVMQLRRATATNSVTGIDEPVDYRISKR